MLWDYWDRPRRFKYLRKLVARVQRAIRKDVRFFSKPSMNYFMELRRFLVPSAMPK